MKRDIEKITHPASFLINVHDKLNKMFLRNFNYDE